MKLEKNNLRLIVMDNCLEFGKKVDDHLKKMKGIKDKEFSFIVPIKLPRFASGEAKAEILESIRAKDVFIITDVMNHSCTYKMHGFVNHKSPDDHFQDLKRIISAMDGGAASIRVIMPFLYESRQHKRKGRESMDSSMALHELENMDVNSIITFDAHDPNIRNALQHCSFDNLYPTYSILKDFIEIEKIDFEDLLVVSPDTGAVDRAIYYADMLGTDVGIYHKRRDYSKVVDGKNPIVAHEYMGADVKNKHVIIVDDMIASGQSMLDVAEQLKARGAKNIYLIASFALFSDGEKSIKAFNGAYNKNIFTKCYSSNLSYVSDEVRKQEWFHLADCSKYLSKLISTLSEHESISPLLNSKEKILSKIAEIKEQQKDSD